MDEDLEAGNVAEIAALKWSGPRAQKIWSGPELRVWQTAEALGLEPTVKAELRDCDYGRWTGQELGEVQLQEPDGVTAWLTDCTSAPHGGESVAELTGRVGQWLNECRGDGHIVAVTHPAVIRAAVVYALNAPVESFWRIDVAPLSLTDLRFNGTSWTLRMLNGAIAGAGGSI